MTDSVIQAYAKHLAQFDEAGVARELSRVKLLALQDVPDESFEPPVTSLGEYLDTPIPIPPSLVWPTIVVRGEITATLGRAGKGKTTMNLNRILRWGCGRPLYDSFRDKEGKPYLAPTDPIKSLIIENEGSAGMFHHKMGVMLNNCGDLLTDEDRALIRENVMVWGDGGYSGLKLDNDGDLGKVRAACEKHSPDLLFIEPFRGLWKGEENSSTDMATVIDNILGMATDFNCGVILSHHERKSGAGEDGELMSAGRGSTVLEGAVAVMENFQSAKGGDFRELTWSKARYLQPPPPVRLEYSFETGWYRHVPEDELEAAILLTLEENSEEPMTKAMLAEALGEKPERVNKSLTKMHKEERLVRMASTFDQSGSTGYRYRIKTQDNTGGGAAF